MTLTLSYKMSSLLFYCIISTVVETVLNSSIYFSSNSIKVSWKAPDQSSINGEFLGYQVSWRERRSGDDEDSGVSRHQIRDPSQTQ